MNDVHDECNKIDQQIEELQQRKKEIIEKATQSCSHPVEAVVELPYESHAYGSERPWLLCKACGLTEEGWGCGYKKLRHAEFKDVPKISRAYWLKTRKKTIYQDENKKIIF